MSHKIFDSGGHQMGTSDGAKFTPSGSGVPHTFDAFDSAGRSFGEVSGNTHFSTSSGGSGGSSGGGIEGFVGGIFGAIIVMILFMVIGVIIQVIASMSWKQRIISLVLIISAIAISAFRNQVVRQGRLGGLCDGTVITVDAQSRNLFIEDKGAWAGGSLTVFLSINGEEYRTNFKESTVFNYGDEWRADRTRRGLAPEIAEVILISAGDPSMRPDNATSTLVSGTYLSQTCNQTVYSVVILPTPTVARTGLVTAQITDINRPCRINRHGCRLETTLNVRNDSYATVTYSPTHHEVSGTPIYTNCNGHVFPEGSIEPGHGTRLVCITRAPSFSNPDIILHPCLEFSAPVLLEGSTTLTTEICL